MTDTPQTERRSNTGIQEVLEAVKRLDDKVTNINTALVGSVEKTEPGLIERVRRLEQWVDSEKKLIYAIALIIVADVVMRLWGLVTTAQAAGLP